MKQHGVVDVSSILTEPKPLPFCAYPGAVDIHEHGVQKLPLDLPLADFNKARPYRSLSYSTQSASNLTAAQVLNMAEVIGKSFAEREPMLRYLQPPKYPPETLMELYHTDAFGSDVFGLWTRERLLYWFIRLLVLTDSVYPDSKMGINQESMDLSRVIVDYTGQVIGGALNETMPSYEKEQNFRVDDIFVNALVSYCEPIFSLLKIQDTEALDALCSRYPEFQEAYRQGKVGHHFMVARSDFLRKADTFELVAASAEEFLEKGYKYMLVEASNQWTGAACEILNGVRVHFFPHQGRLAVRKSDKPAEKEVSSPNGWLSNKNSGIMFYVICLKK